MQSKSYKSGLGILELVLIILVISLLIFLFFRLTKLMRSKTEDLPEIIPDELPDELPTIQLNPESKLIPEFYKKVVETLPDMDKNMQLFLTAQAMHETGIFDSSLYVDHNNAFGMMFPHIRDNVAKAQTDEGFASYVDIETSIKDMELYLQFVESPKNFETISDYAKFLKDKGYYTDSLKTYTNALTKHLNNLKRYAQ
jgi:hypothetical protein